jgi:acetolactate synthase-1/2/3 large subunit
MKPPSTLAELILADARERGLRHWFGLPGAGAPLDLLDAGRRMGVEFVSVAHESSAAIMAAYHGALLGTAGLSIAIKGVGAGNLAAGACNAWFERMPVVAMCERAPASWKLREMIQVCDHAALFGGITKMQATLSPEDAPRILRELAFAATDGRPGPVLVDLPTDLASAPVGPLPPPMPPRAPAAPAPAALAAAADFLKDKRRPVVVAGGDVLRAGALGELRGFVEAIGAAVLVAIDSRGTFPESHPRWAGVLFGIYNPNTLESEILSRADAVVLVGMDTMMTQNPWKSALPTCELVARAEYATLTQPKARVDGDLKAALRALTPAPRAGFDEPEIRAAKDKIAPFFRRPGGARLAAQDVLAIARRRLPSDGLLFTETGAFVLMLETLWPVDLPNTYFGTTGGRTMGLTVPALLGAALARPGHPMLGIGADGSLRMRLGELEAFARAKANVPLVIINDGALGTMKSRQKSRRLADYGLDAAPVDFAAVARACGLRGVTVDTPEAFEEELRLATWADRATLIDARVDPQPYQDNFGPTIGSP